MRKIKQGDKVVVLTGKYKGRTGNVLKIFTKENKVKVEGVNFIKKHVKPNPSRNEQGGIIQKEAPIHVSNVSILNPATGKADRVGFKLLEDGKKVRYFKSNNELVDI